MFWENKIVAFGPRIIDMSSTDKARLADIFSWMWPHMCFCNVSSGTGVFLQTPASYCLQVGTSSELAGESQHIFTPPKMDGSNGFLLASKGQLLWQKSDLFVSLHKNWPTDNMVKKKKTKWSGWFVSYLGLCRHAGRDRYAFCIFAYGFRFLSSKRSALTFSRDAAAGQTLRSQPVTPLPEHPEIRCVARSP